MASYADSPAPQPEPPMPPAVPMPPEVPTTHVVVTTGEPGAIGRFVDQQPVLFGLIALTAIVALALIGLRLAAMFGPDPKPAETGPADLETTRKFDLLAAENDRLRAQNAGLEERIAVVERILTDPARRVSDEIEALR